MGSNYQTMSLELKGIHASARSSCIFIDFTVNKWMVCLWLLEMVICIKILTEVASAELTHCTHNLNLFLKSDFTNSSQHEGNNTGVLISYGSSH